MLQPNYDNKAKDYEYIVTIYIKAIFIPIHMTYSYLDHEADVGILAEGETLEEAFAEGAKGAFNVMVNINEVRKKKSVSLNVESPNIESLFVEWLNELISLADMNSMFFCEFEVHKIKKEIDKYILDAVAWGEEIDQKRHVMKTEVKAATYYGLKYEQKKGKHIIQCVVDV
jgi:SHS2 domain-containing protein